MATETPFSFHCMICFEEFHHEDRYPVVLPCGHTYVCHVCAQRLDKCMECRTPLYTIEKPQPPRTSPLNSVYAPSYRRGGQQSPEPIKKPAPPVKKRLPLPKNVVLLSLIEATELASEGAQKKFRVSPQVAAAASPSFESAESKESKIEDEEDEQERIKMSTSLALGKSGTYAVAAPDGLEIFSRRQQYVNDDASTTQTDDVERMVQHFHLDQSTDEEVRELTTSLTQSSVVKDNARLQYGDRVQIVSIDGGWAKMARGYGFIKADKHLVKVGGSVDMACKLEAMLRFLSKQRKELRLAQNKIDNQFIQVLNELQVSLKQNEDLTVICGATFNTPEFAVSPEKTPEEKPKPAKTVRITSSCGSEESDDYSFAKPKKKPEVDPTAGRNRFMCFANNFLENDDGEPTLPSLTLLPTNSLMASLPWSDSTDSASSPVQHAARGFSTSRPSESQLRAGAQAWRERHGREASQGTDFRTGMSGHMGLSQGNEYLGQCKSHSGFPRMSSHTGLSVRSPSYQRGGQSRLRVSTMMSRTAHPRLAGAGGFPQRDLGSSLTLPYSPEHATTDHQVPNSGSM